MARKILRPPEWTRDGRMLLAANDSETESLIFLDNSPYASGQAPDGANVGTLWGYSAAASGVTEYTGDPTRRVQLPTGAGRGHGFCVLPSGHLVVATSEDHTGNGRESWFLVPPGAVGVLDQAECPRIRCEQLFAGTYAETGGARHAINWGDGTIILGTNGTWKPVTIDAWSMSDGELAALPGWSYWGNATNSGIGDYDWARQPGTDRLVIQGHDRVWALDLSLATKDLTTVSGSGTATHNSTSVPGGDGLDWILHGSNVGRPAAEVWEGFIAFDAAGGLWKQRGDGVGNSGNPYLVYFSAATLAGLPKLGNQVSANPAADKILTCPLWDVMDLGVESVFVALEIDSLGGIWTASFSYGGGFPPGQAFHFSAEAVAAGGSQSPDRIINLPAESQASYVRMAHGLAAHVR